MPKNLDEEIIELTEVVEDSDQELGEEELLSAFDKHELFKQPAPSDQSVQDRLEDENLEDFFSGEAELSKADSPSAQDAKPIGEKEPARVLQEPLFDEEFQSVLNGLTKEIQEKQQEDIIKEEFEEPFDFEKQWKAALGGEEAEGETGGIMEGGDMGHANLREFPDLFAPWGKTPATASPLSLEQALSAQLNREVADLLKPEIIEGVLENALRQVLEPLAERILTEVAEKILAQEIERIKADFRDVERKP